MTTVKRRRHEVSHHHYPIRAALDYRLIGHEWILQTGTAWTIYLSSRSVLIESQTNLALHTRVDLSIEWPARLENDVCLRLYIAGRTVSVTGTFTEVEILGYEFRTRAHTPRPINEARNRGGRLELTPLWLHPAASGSPSPTRQIKRV